jgi:thymidylate kinase
MIFIVEGIDRVGKTTLIDRVTKSTNIKGFRGNDTDFFTLDKLDNINETDKFLKIIKLCKLFDADIIFDRFYWSDFVYGCLGRHYDFTKANEYFEKVEKELLQTDAMVIYIKPVDIKFSNEQHGKDLDKHDKLFDYLFSITKLQKMKCDFTTLWKAEEEIDRRLSESYANRNVVKK